MAPHSRGVRLGRLGRLGLNPRPRAYNTTSPPAYHRQVWFGLSPFRSPLLGGSRLISPPSPTKMFPFGEFPYPIPLRVGYAPKGAGGPIRGSRDQRLHAPTPGISPLAAPFLGARAEPSTGWPGAPSRQRF